MDLIRFLCVDSDVDYCTSNIHEYFRGKCQIRTLFID
jgi:hypothetical protein